MRKKKTTIAIIGILSLLIPITYAGLNVVHDPSFESKGHWRDIGVYDTEGDGEVDGFIELTKEESYSGKRCVHMWGGGVDYPRVFTPIKKEVSLDEITSVSFWYKHREGSDPNTPFAVMKFWVEGKEYEGWQLNLYQWYQTSGPCDEWTLFDSDSWHYRVWIPGEGMTDYLESCTLAEIQDMYDAVLFTAGIAMGASEIGFGGPADVYVDHLMVNTS
jgi:hypothetical protein